MLTSEREGFLHGFGFTPDEANQEFRLQIWRFVVHNISFLHAVYKMFPLPCFGGKIIMLKRNDIIYCTHTLLHALPALPALSQFHKSLQSHESCLHQAQTCTQVVPQIFGRSSESGELSLYRGCIRVYCANYILWIGSNFFNNLQNVIAYT